MLRLIALFGFSLVRQCHSSLLSSGRSLVARSLRPQCLSSSVFLLASPPSKKPFSTELSSGRRGSLANRISLFSAKVTEQRPMAMSIKEISTRIRRILVSSFSFFSRTFLNFLSRILKFWPSARSFSCLFPVNFLFLTRH